MPEPMISAESRPPQRVTISITTHADAEIFLIGNDRQLVERAVGYLRTEQPPGIYRLKVTRAAGTIEKLIDVDDDFSEHVAVEGMDTIVPFDRTLSSTDRTVIDRVTSRYRQSAIMVLGRIVATAGEHVGQLSVGVSPWLDPAIAAPSSSQATSPDGTRWAAWGAEALPGTHVVEIDDSVRRMRHAVLVLDGWQTRVFIRRQVPSPSSETSPVAKAGATDISVHLSRHDAPIALEQEYEPSEVARWSLAMGRTALSNARVINIFLDEKFFDPMAGIAAAHLMFDGVEKVEKSASPHGSQATYDPGVVMANLTRLLGAQAASSPDLVALKLRAGTALTASEKAITAPPVYTKSWTHLLKASTGENPLIELAPEVFKECAANFSCGPYLAWSPVSISAFVEHVVASNLPVLAAKAAALISEKHSSDDASPNLTDLLAIVRGSDEAANATLPDATLEKSLDGGAFDRLRRGLGRARALADRLPGLDLKTLQAPRDWADRIIEGAKPVASEVLKSVREGTRDQATKLTEAILSHDTLRAAFADNLNIPRSVVDDLFKSAPEAVAGDEEAPVQSGANVVRLPRRTAASAASSAGLTQAQIDSCAGLTWETAADIDGFFAASGGFFRWYNAKLSQHPAFRHRGAISITPERLARFKAFWDRIPDVFARAQISGLEFAALMSVSVQETNGNLWASPEKVGNAAHPGISYAFDAIPGLKASYNDNPGLGNKTAKVLFADVHYVNAHKTLPGFAAVTQGGIDPAWGGSQWPSAFGAAHFKKEDASLNGFVMQADFYKLRGRGVIQTTGREAYKVVIDFIMTSAAAAANPALLTLRDTWNALPGASGPDKLDLIASCSTNAQLDAAFAQSEVLAAGVHLDSKRKQDYLDIGRTAAIVNGGTSTKGSFLFMARRINAGNYPATAAPMMAAMAGAIAELAQAAGDVEMAIPMRAGSRAVAKKRAKKAAARSGSRKAKAVAKKVAKKTAKKSAKKTAKKTAKKASRKTMRKSKKGAPKQLRKKQPRRSAKRRGRR